MIRTTTSLLGLLLVVTIPVWADVVVSLRGSPESMVRQNRVAKQNNYTFFRTPAQVQAAARAGDLVPLSGNENYEVKDDVSFAVARPEVRLFIQQFAAQYRSACRERLVVTSLTRPITRQPPNAHHLSVHPAGMAFDLRIPRNARCRTWIERELLSLERQGVLDATREHDPPHYHVALFPEGFLEYLNKRIEVDPVLAGIGEATPGNVEAQEDLLPVTQVKEVTTERDSNLSTAADMRRRR